MDPVYRLFVDEVGHANMKAAEHPNERYLSLTGIIMRIDYECGLFKSALDILKARIFATTEIVLHRTEMVYHRPPFQCLEDEEVRRDFDESLIQIIGNAQYRVITVVIDKDEHKKRYQVWHAYPYHYCLMALLERYVLWLNLADTYGDVLAESRGKKENISLINSYRRLYDGGTPYVSKGFFQKRLTTKELKIREKTANIAGLQLADLVANPSMRSMVCAKLGQQMTADFGRRVVEILEKNKYRRQNGIIAGFGRKWLP